MLACDCHGGGLQNWFSQWLVWSHPAPGPVVRKENASDIKPRFLKFLQKMFLLSPLRRSSEKLSHLLRQGTDLFLYSYFCKLWPSSSQLRNASSNWQRTVAFFNSLTTKKKREHIDTGEISYSIFWHSRIWQADLLPIHQWELLFSVDDVNRGTNADVSDLITRFNAFQIKSEINLSKMVGMLIARHQSEFNYLRATDHLSSLISTENLSIYSRKPRCLKLTPQNYLSWRYSIIGSEN